MRHCKITGSVLTMYMHISFRTTICSYFKHLEPHTALNIQDALFHLSFFNWIESKFICIAKNSEVERLKLTCQMMARSHN